MTNILQKCSSYCVLQSKMRVGLVAVMSLLCRTFATTGLEIQWFWVDFWSFLAPFSSKMHLKIDFKFWCIFDRRFDDFWLELGSHLAPKSRQNGAGWCGMVAFFLVPAAHVAPSRHLDPFWTIFSSIWAPFWLSEAHVFLDFVSLLASKFIRNCYHPPLRKTDADIRKRRDQDKKRYENTGPNVLPDRSFPFASPCDDRPSHKTSLS